MRDETSAEAQPTLSSLSCSFGFSGSLNETSKMNQINETNQTDQLRFAPPAIPARLASRARCRPDRPASTLAILFQSVEEFVQPFLVRRSHGNEAHADFSTAAPTHSRPLDNNR